MKGFLRIAIIGTTLALAAAGCIALTKQERFRPVAAADSADPAGLGFGVTLAAEECGRAWVIERARGDVYRVVNLTYVLGPVDPECPDIQMAFEVEDLCSRMFLIERDPDSLRARLTRLRSKEEERHWYDGTDGCPP